RIKLSKQKHSENTPKKGNPNQKNKKDQTQPKQLRKAHTQKRAKTKTHYREQKQPHHEPLELEVGPLRFRSTGIYLRRTS
ncbi:hypothetical protein MHW98_03605, partial [Winkia sp. ACRQY]|uniref:hypothetical protein n=1 Tax=Winkia sp. ACRQY TaxID=2918182 RepID=UPI001EF16250